MALGKSTSSIARKFECSQIPLGAGLFLFLKKASTTFDSSSVFSKDSVSIVHVLCRIHLSEKEVSLNWETQRLYKDIELCDVSIAAALEDLNKKELSFADFKERDQYFKQEKEKCVQELKEHIAMLHQLQRFQPKMRSQAKFRVQPGAVPAHDDHLDADAAGIPTPSLEWQSVVKEDLPAIFKALEEQMFASESESEQAELHELLADLQQRGLSGVFNVL